MNNNIIRAYRHKTDKNRILEIHQDEDAESPRSWDNLGTMACAHNRYTLGDTQVNSQEEFDELIKDSIISIPLYLYDHSGLRISAHTFNDKWDSGQIGIIFVTRDKLIEEYGKITPKTKEIARRVLLGEVETYDDYLSGNVYGYVEYKQVNCNMNETHKEQIDSCWGFIGDLDKCGIFENYKLEEWEEIEEKELLA